MKAAIILTMVVVIGLVWKQNHSTRQLPAGYNRNHLRTEPALTKHRYNNLQLYPIYASSEFLALHAHLGPYTMLTDAIDQKKIQISERSIPDVQAPPAEVNRLFLENVSADTLIILGGEVVRGGKQDRMIAQDFLLLPHSGKADISVYCVERDRWTVGDEDVLFEESEDIAPSRVRQALTIPQTQQAVWDAVDEIKLEAEVSSTDALVAVLEDKSYQAFIQPYKDQLLAIDWPKNVVGVIAVFNDEVVGCDIFAQHDLFIKYYPSLVSSYSGHAYQPDNNAQLPYPKVENFIQTLLHDEDALEIRLKQTGSQLKHGQYRLHLAAY